MSRTITPLPRYFVLLPNGYPDTMEDYCQADNLDHAAIIARRHADGYLDGPSAHVFAGEREPWTEVDPYPDYAISTGPRGGVRIERA